MNTIELMRELIRFQEAKTGEDVREIKLDFRTYECLMSELDKEFSGDVFGDVKVYNLFPFFSQQPIKINIIKKNKFIIEIMQKQRE